MARPTRADVAKLADVAPSTVSLVLNGYSQELKIAAETVSQVQEAANQLGYVPHAAARSLRSRKARLLGLFMPELPQDPFIPVIEQVVLQAIAAGQFRGYTVVPILQPLDSPTTLRSILRDIDLAGAVCDLSFADHALTTMLISMDIPRVYLSPLETNDEPLGDGLISVLETPGMMGLYDAMEHDPEADIVYVSGPTATPARREAIATATGAPPIEVTLASWSAVAAEKALSDLWERHPKAGEIWCAADTFAVGARAAAARAGLRVPEDVQIVGFGDFAGPAELDLNLTSVYWPLKEATDLALHRAVDVIDSRSGDDNESPGAEAFTLPASPRLRGTTRLRRTTDSK